MFGPTEQDFIFLSALLVNVPFSLFTPKLYVF